MLMRILHVIDQIGVEYGGSAMAARKLSKALAGFGHDVTVYSSDSSAYMEVPDVPKLQNFEVVYSYQDSIRITPSMIYADFDGFDIIHCHNYYTFQNFIARLRNRKTPMILQPHGTFVMYDPLINKPRFLHKLTDWPWRRAFLSKMHSILCVSWMELAQANRLSLRNLELIPNGVDMSEYAELPSPGRFRDRYNIKDSEKVILYIGRHHILKGLDILLGVFQNTKNKNNRLAVVGAFGQERSEDNLLFCPALYGTKKLEAYVDADVVVLPSRYDVFGITALEALACGTPVVASLNCGIKDFVSEPLIYYSYFADLNDAIQDVLNSDTKNEFKKARINKAKKFDWPIIAKQVEGIYCELVGQTGATGNRA